MEEVCLDLFVILSRAIEISLKTQFSGRSRRGFEAFLMLCTEQKLRRQSGGGCHHDSSASVSSNEFPFGISSGFLEKRLQEVVVKPFPFLLVHLAPSSLGVPLFGGGFVVLRLLCLWLTGSASRMFGSLAK